MTVLASLAREGQRDNPDVVTCHCDDPDTLTAAALIEGGTPIMDACRVVWGSGPRDVVEQLRLGYVQAFTWLRLPPVERAA